MQYAWAVVGAKVAYIGPPFIVVIIGGMPAMDMPAPCDPNKVYTLSAVTTYMNTLQIAVEIAEMPGNLFQVELFKPVQKKDEEMFNKMLNDIPTDLHVERLDELARELDHAI